SATVAIVSLHDAYAVGRAFEDLRVQDLRALELCQIEHERDALLAAVLESRRPEQHRDVAAVLADVLLLVRLHDAGHLQLIDRLGGAVAPVRRSETGPVHATADQILAVVADRSQKGVVGFANPAAELPDEDADDVGIDQTADPGLTLLDIAVQTGDVEGDRRLRGQHLEQGRTLR